MAPVYTVYLPLLYALCSHRDKETYELLYNVIAGKFEELHLTHAVEKVTLDFEQAASGGITTVFPDVSIEFCFFHFAQSMWRKIQKEGLQAAYEEQTEDGEKIRIGFTMLLALGFVPEAHVIPAFEELCTTLPEALTPLAEHLDWTYIRGRPIRGAGRGGNTRRTRPMFAIRD